MAKETYYMHKRDLHADILAYLRDAVRLIRLIGHELCAMTDEVCGVTNEVCGVTTEVCDVTKEVCGATREVCGATKEVCGATNEVCGATKEVCGRPLRAPRSDCHTHIIYLCTHDIFYICTYVWGFGFGV
jgi:hypothetical protein